MSNEPISNSQSVSDPSPSSTPETSQAGPAQGSQSTAETTFDGTMSGLAASGAEGEELEELLIQGLAMQINKEIKHHQDRLKELNDEAERLNNS